MDLSSYAHPTSHGQSGPFSSFSLRYGYHWWLRCRSMRLVSGGVLWCTRTTNAVILMAEVLLWTRNSSSLTYWEDYWLNFGPMTGQIWAGEATDCSWTIPGVVYLWFWSALAHWLPPWYCTGDFSCIICLFIIKLSWREKNWWFYFLIITCLGFWPRQIMQRSLISVSI